MTLPIRTRVAHFLLLLTALAAPAFGQGAGDALMRLLKTGKLPEGRMPAVIEQVAKRGDAADLGFLFEKTAQKGGWTGDVAAAALSGLVDAAENRKLQPTGDLGRLGTLLAAERPEGVRLSAVRLAGLWRVPELAGPLTELAKSDRTSPRLRAAALQSLASYGDAGRKTIESLATAGRLSVRAEAIAALAGLDQKAAATAAAAALAAAGPQDDPTPVLAAFLDRQGGPQSLADALATAKLSPAVAKAALRRMYAMGRSDAALSAALGKAAGIAMEDKPVTPEEIKTLSAAVLADGDAARGQLVFRRDDLSCTKCHAIGGVGGNVGPDLAAIGASSPVDYLVTSILEPDQAVKEHYETQVVLTIDGLVLTGVVANEDATRLVLRTADGSEKSVPKADVDAREKGSSLMPKGLVKFMTRDELLDLVRFLSELGKPGTPYALPSPTTVRRWRILADPPAPLAAGVPVESVFNTLLPKADAEGWRPVYAFGNGELPLDGLSAGGTEPVYLLAQIDVRTSGAVGLKLDSVAGLDVWVNGDHLDAISPSFATEFPRRPASGRAAGRSGAAVREDVAAGTLPPGRLVGGRRAGRRGMTESLCEKAVFTAEDAEFAGEKEEIDADAESLC